MHTTNSNSNTETGNVLVTVACFFGTVALALLLLLQLFRYGLAVADLQKAADAAAEAAAAAVDLEILRATGMVFFSGSGQVDLLMSYNAERNSTYLAPAGYPLSCAVTAINDAQHTVTVKCSAHVSALFQREQTFTRPATAQVRGAAIHAQLP